MALTPADPASGHRPPASCGASCEHGHRVRTRATQPALPTPSQASPATLPHSPRKAASKSTARSSVVSRRPPQPCPTAARAAKDLRAGERADPAAVPAWPPALPGEQQERQEARAQRPPRSRPRPATAQPRRACHCSTDVGGGAARGNRRKHRAGGDRGRRGPRQGPQGNVAAQAAVFLLQRGLRRPGPCWAHPSAGHGGGPPAGSPRTRLGSRKVTLGTKPPEGLRPALPPAPQEPPHMHVRTHARTHAHTRSRTHARTHYLVELLDSADQVRVAGRVLEIDVVCR